MQSECGGCGGEKRWVLHNVRPRAAYRRLCTNCILNSHQGMFCPFCLEVYEECVLPPQERLMCLKCPSISHLSCVPCSHPHSPRSFLCPACSSSSPPNFTFFNVDNINSKKIDKGSAKAFVAAAKIAAVSMAKAAAVARIEAETRVKEATLAKKRAREALETLAYLTAKHKESKEAYHPNKLTTNNNKRIQADGIISKRPSTQPEKPNSGVHSISPPAVNAAATHLKRH